MIFIQNNVDNDEDRSTMHHIWWEIILRASI